MKFRTKNWNFRHFETEEEGDEMFQYKTSETTSI
jgi:hypothetical protein